VGADTPRRMRLVNDGQVSWNTSSDEASMDVKEKKAIAKLDTENDTGVSSWIIVHATGDGVGESVTGIDGVVDGVAGMSPHVIDTEHTDDVDAASTVMLSKYAAPAPRKPGPPMYIPRLAGLPAAIPDADNTGTAALLGGKK
jgi:hypothetical protein